MQLQNYTILSKLGEGGMATVYLAEHKILQKPCAIKVLFKKYTDDEHIRKRFLAEARNLYTMSHPNIIKVTDLIDEGDTVAFVMEHIDGETLKEFLDRKGKLTDDEIRNIFSQMLEAVGYVHKKGLVHRDIKPSNFMIDKEGTVKLLDFGIAKNTDPSSAEYTQTGTGMQMGTPMYMSPEQIKETKAVSYQSDIYSLGVVLWQLVTGERPYNMATLSNFDLQTKIVNEPLSSTGSSFDGVIKKAIDKDPTMRFTDCEGFKNSLLNKASNTVNEKTVFVNSVEKTILNKPHEDTLVRKPVLPATFTDEFGIEFILVEAGTFVMGASPNSKDVFENEKPSHTVTLTENYYIGKYSVNQAQWGKIMKNNPSYFKNRPNCPVESVSWFDCEDFVKKLCKITGKNYRMPTEAEWEFAARGGTKSKGYLYSGSNNIDDVSWHAGNSETELINKKIMFGLLKDQQLVSCPSEVGQKKPNELGIYDMSGNVWEWCSDWYDSYNSKNKVNPIGRVGIRSIGLSDKVLRGGSYVDVSKLSRPSVRFFSGPYSIRINFGFRLVLMP